MPTNNQKIKKPINQESIIYALIFVLYTAITILLFVYAAKFLGATINSALSSPVNSDVEARYGQLKLDDYSVVAGKLNLSSGRNNENQTPVSQAISTTSVAMVASSSITSVVPVASSSITSTIISTASSTAPIVVIAPTTQIQAQGPGPSSLASEIKPKISIVNSTAKSGLAAALKNKLQSAGFEVIKTGNTRPSEVQTIIRIKSDISQSSSYLTQIKKIVSESYDFTTEVFSDQAANYDLEIVIGNK